MTRPSLFHDDKRSAVNEYIKRSKVGLLSFSSSSNPRHNHIQAKQSSKNLTSTKLQNIKTIYTYLIKTHQPNNKMTDGLIMEHVAAPSTSSRKSSHQFQNTTAVNASSSRNNSSSSEAKRTSRLRAFVKKGKQFPPWGLYPL